MKTDTPHPYSRMYATGIAYTQESGDPCVGVSFACANSGAQSCDFLAQHVTRIDGPIRVTGGCFSELPKEFLEWSIYCSKLPGRFYGKDFRPRSIADRVRNWYAGRLKARSDAISREYGKAHISPEGRFSNAP